MNQRINSLLPPQAKQQSTTSIKSQLWLVMLMVVITQLSMALILPGLPYIARDLQVDSSVIRWLVSVFLIGLGIGQLIYGPCSDSVGRRPVLLAGLAIGGIGSSLCVLSNSFSMLLVGRALSGFGVAVLPVLARSCLRDTHEGQSLTRALGSVAIVAAFAPTVAPLLAGWVTAVFGWLALFQLLACLMVMAMGLYLIYFVETHPTSTAPLQLSSIIMNYGRLLKDPYFLSRFSGQALLYLIMVLNISLGPFLLQDQLGLSVARYGELMMLPSLGILAGGWLRRRFCQTVWLDRMVITLWAIGGLILIALPLSVEQFITAVFLQMVSYGALFPVVTSSLLQPYRKMAGSVVALAGSLQFLVSGILGGLLSRHIILNTFSLGVAFIIGALGIACIFTSWRRIQTSQNEG